VARRRPSACPFGAIEQGPSAVVRRELEAGGRSEIDDGFGQRRPEMLVLPDSGVEPLQVVIGANSAQGAECLGTREGAVGGGWLQGYELVAHPANQRQMAGGLGELLQLVTKAVDTGVGSAGAYAWSIVPDFGEQLLTRHRPVTMGRQIGEDRGLVPGHRGRLTVADQRSVPWLGIAVYECEAMAESGGASAACSDLAQRLGIVLLTGEHHGFGGEPGDGSRRARRHDNAVEAIWNRFALRHLEAICLEQPEVPVGLRP